MGHLGMVLNPNGQGLRTRSRFESDQVHQLSKNFFLIVFIKVNHLNQFIGLKHLLNVFTLHVS